MSIPAKQCITHKNWLIVKIDCSLVFYHRLAVTGEPLFHVNSLRYSGKMREAMKNENSNVEFLREWLE